MPPPPSSESAPPDASRFRLGPVWLERSGRVSLWIITISIALYIVGHVAIAIRVALIPVILAITLSTLLVPIARVLRRVRVPAPLASALAIILALGSLTGLAVMFGVGIAGEFDQLKSSMRQGYRELLAAIAPIAGIAPHEIKEWLNEQVASFDQSRSLAQRAFSGMIGLVQALTVFGLTLVFVWFFVWDGDKQFDTVLSYFPKERRATLRKVSANIWETVGGYMRGVFLIALSDAVLLCIGLWIIRMPLVLPLTLLMFLGALVPFAGPFVAGAVAALVALSHGGLTQAALAILVALIVLQIEGNFIQPFVMGRAVKLHPAVVVFAVTVGGVLGGVLGVFLAIPVAACIASTYELLSESPAEDPRLSEAPADKQN